MRMARRYLLLLLIFLLAAATRIINIDGPSLWIDEGFTYYTFKADLFTALLGDRHPPLYFYSLHVWERLAGDSILALRYWSFLPSMLSIAVIYQIAREVVRERSGLRRMGILSVPVLAALMMALADGENYLAQELRMYTWQVLLCALSTLFYLRWIRKHDRTSAVWWVVFMTLALYTHYFSAFVLIVLGVHAVLFLPFRRKIEAVVLLALTGVFFLPWVFTGLREQLFATDLCVNCGEAMNLETLLSFRQSWFGQMWPLMMLLAVFGIWNQAGIHKVVSNHQGTKNTKILSAFGSFLIAYRLTCLILLLGLLPLALTFLISHEYLVFFNHHLAQLTIPVVLLIALGLGNLQMSARVVLVVAIVLYSVTTVDWYRQKAPWRELVVQFAPYVEPDQLVLSEIGAEEAALGYYFDHLLPTGTQISAFEWWGVRDVNAYYNEQLPALIISQAERQQPPVTTAWFVYWNANLAMLQQLEANGFVPTMMVSVEHEGSILPAYRYDILPDTLLATFDSGLVLRAAEIDPDKLRVDLWWSLEVPTTTEYVTKAFLLDANGVQVAQIDSQPLMSRRPTTSFQSGEVVYDPKWLQLEPGISELAPGTYTVAVQVYSFVDGSIILSKSGDEDTVIVGTLER